MIAAGKQPNPKRTDDPWNIIANLYPLDAQLQKMPSSRD